MTSAYSACSSRRKASSAASASPAAGPPRGEFERELAEPDQRPLDARDRAPSGVRVLGEPAAGHDAGLSPTSPAAPDPDRDGSASPVAATSGLVTVASPPGWILYRVLSARNLEAGAVLRLPMPSLPFEALASTPVSSMWLHAAVAAACESDAASQRKRTAASPVTGCPSSSRIRFASAPRSSPSMPGK